MKQKNYPLYETTVFEDFRIMVENAADKAPEKTAFSYKVSPFDTDVVKKSFEDVRLDVRYLGTAIHEKGLSEKNVAVIGAASYGWIVSYFSLMASGAITVPADKDMPADDLAGIINKAKCEAVFYSTEICEKVETFKASCPTVKYFVCMNGAPASEDDLTVATLAEEGKASFEGGNNVYYDYVLDPDKLASIVFTSGTTGKGKGVMLTQTNIVSDMTQGMYNFAITPKTMLVLPPHHTFGSTVNIVGHFSQNAEVYISNGIKYFQKEMLEQQPSHLILVPLFIETLYKRIWATAEKSGQANKLRSLIKISNGMRKAGVDMRQTLFKTVTKKFGGKLEMVICGGAALNQDIIDFFDAIGITLLNGYGITECAPLISCNRNKYQKKGSVGTPIIGEEVKIADPDENGEGEICVKGPNVMLGYYEDPEATAAAFDEEGFFKTGDYGKVDEEGWLYITGRLKNLIIFSNGKNVYPEEIESEISRIYGVNEVVVYAGESKSNPDKEVIVAEIYPDVDGLKDKGIEDIKAYFTEEVKKANANMVSYKSVGSIKIRDTEFPKNTSRKITRFAIDKTVE
jgi:long-chain acyl-CoA synthetase